MSWKIIDKIYNSNVGGDIIIKFKNVSKKFIDNKEEQEVLNDVSFEIEKGTITGIVGNTGSGKSTILKLVNGFLISDSGKVLIDDVLLTNDNKKEVVRETSFIFQHFNLLNNLNVLDNVSLSLKLKGIKKPERTSKSLEVIDYVGLSHLVNNYPKTLSGGEKQRVAIARSLMTNPRILIMDEPTSALDQKMSLDILKLLKDINQKDKTTMVIVSHDLDLLKSICSKVIILEEGTISSIVEIDNKDIVNKSYKERLLDD